MPVFNLLAHPESYYCCTQNMLVDVEFRNFWLDHFSHHFDLIMSLAVQVYGPESSGRAMACKAALVKEMESLRGNPAKYDTMNLQVMGKLRQDILKAHDLPDPFLLNKQRENSAMLALYPEIISDLDRPRQTRSESDTLRLLVEGVFAGNIFDMGATETAKLFASGSPDFRKVRQSLDGNRPWLVDHFDAFAQRLLHGGGYNKALFFMDNAGSDAVLGVLPLVRWLAARGTQVCLLANESAALNDIIATELCDLLDRIRAIDPVMDSLLQHRRIAAGSSGGGTPLIDLMDVSDECNAMAAEADLVFLEGMGRGLESNFNILLTTDVVKLCMVKEEIIARRHGGKVFDVVFRFDRAVT